jgi:hypothetical protein
MRTNPVYAHIAYRRTLLVALRDDLLDAYSVQGSPEPRKVLMCDRVFQEDARVPESSINDMVLELNEEIAAQEAQLSKFEFAQTGERNGLFKSKVTQGQQVSRTSQQQGRGQANRR